MPRFDEMYTGGVGGFGFSGIRTDRLGAAEYTLVSIVVDVTGSVGKFANQLRQCIVDAVDACKKSPRSANLLVRVVLFAEQFPNGIHEVHGFLPLADIDPARDYPQLRPGGGTPLYDACYAAVSAMNVYGKKLVDDDFGVNAICFVITDGDDNTSRSTPAMVRQEIDNAVCGEIMESMVSILIGINARDYITKLQDFQLASGMAQFIDAGEVSPGRLAKLAAFVSQSVTSQSQAMGTGGPSLNIAAVI